MDELAEPQCMKLTVGFPFGVETLHGDVVCFADTRVICLKLLKILLVIHLLILTSKAASPPCHALVHLILP